MSATTGLQMLFSEGFFNKIHMKWPVVASMESPFLALLPNFHFWKGDWAID